MTVPRRPCGPPRTFQGLEGGSGFLRIGGTSGYERFFGQGLSIRVFFSLCRGIENVVVLGWIVTC